jgi:alpha-amylase/alpha-mannosidase (GH57 family)
MRYVCIHCHFYQPPRENPWLEAIELQDSAYPYHDWNDRITAESYAPNAFSRVLDGSGKIVRIVNNYSRISFNVGPTLLSWMEDKARELYDAIREADRESKARFSGHGSAIAQAYNHMIMPLANRRDKWTQIAWGIADFRKRFERMPEGMWLPETAVDNETLDIMAEQGIKFTILAPYQCKRVRKIGAGSRWREVAGGGIDPSRAYRLRLASGRHIDVFFYDGPISRAVAFEGLLANGEHFAQRVLSASSDARDWPELLHIATDGETYGHHHRYGEMALTYALQHLEEQNLARITNYAEYLEMYPPNHEVEIFENTAWSCAHGVERWNSDCGCNGGRAGWNQAWRGPLRRALDWLRDCVAPLYESKAAQLVRDPWLARDAYIDLILNRYPESRAAFLEEHAGAELTTEQQTTLWKLLEMQRHTMLMYTSCGWFFDELSGIETVQVIQYAGRVVQLAEELFSQRIEAEFMDRLRDAKSNVAEHGDGAQIYEKLVKPTVVDLHKVAAHYAISSMFHSNGDEERIFCYSTHRQDFRTWDAGKMRLAIGRARLVSEVTQEWEELSFGVLHFGDHNISGGVRVYQGDISYTTLVREAADAFARADLPEALRVLDKGFGPNIYSLKSLFKDEQRRILGVVMNSTLDEAAAVYRQLYEHHAPLMRYLSDLRIPLPKAFQTTAEYALNSNLRRALAQERLDSGRILGLLEEARTAAVELDKTTLEFTFRRNLEGLTTRFAQSPGDMELLRELSEAIELIVAMPFPTVLWAAQNRFYNIWHETAPKMLMEESHSDEAREWLTRLRRICDVAGVRA